MKSVKRPQHTLGREANRRVSRSTAWSSLRRAGAIAENQSPSAAVAVAMTLILITTAFGQVPELVINEVDYDQPGADSQEWVEIRNTQDIEVYTSDVNLVLYDADVNGTCTEYCRVDLSSLGFINAGQHIVVGAHPFAVLPLCSSTNAIQNGAPDAIALVKLGDVIDSMEYESGLSGSVCNFTLTSKADSDSIDGSLQVCTVYFNWHFVPVATPAARNDCSTATDVLAVRRPVQVLAIFPNPSRRTTTLRFELERPDHVLLQVFDVAGHRLRTLARGSFGPGPHVFEWDGRDQSGRRVSAGAYLVRLDGRASSSSRLVTLLR